MPRRAARAAECRGGGTYDRGVASEERAVRALATGRVQGVGFRLSCAREAERLGVSGYVRNLEDGRVEVVARGERSAVEALLAWCMHGPPGALVTEVAVVPGEGPGGEAGDRGAGPPRSGSFSIR